MYAGAGPPVPAFLGEHMPETNVIDKIKKIICGVVAIGLALFHMWTASFGIIPSYEQAAIHWIFIGSLIIIMKPLKGVMGKILDTILFFANIFVCIYHIHLQNVAISNAGAYSQFDIYVGVAAVIIALLVASRYTGKILPIISIIFIAYAFFGRYIPGMLKTVKFSIRRIAPWLYLSNDGLFGQTLTVSAQYIYLFVLFGALLDLTGAGKFFVDISYSLTYKLKGGPAQAAVFSSMLMGTINGSGAANVVTTGTFTIPLMKRVGFKSEFAGAVEAVSSSGGQIMPPVMGAVAFLMSEMTGISYGTIALAALIPAVLYYVTLSVSVLCIAHKTDVPDPDTSDIRKPGEIMKEGWLYLVPLAVLIFMLIRGFSAQRAAFFSILATIVVGFIKNRQNMTPKKFFEALLGAAKSIAPIASACILAGIVMGVINLTGLGLKISSLIESIANGRLLIGLLLAMVTSLILGMGLPTSAAYMILAILVGPALVDMGASLISAHLFLLYFGALSTITPPVALSTFAAAGIAEADTWKTGIEAMKLAITGFVIPFVFVFSNELLWVGNAGHIILALLTAVIGCIFVAFGLTGWAKFNISLPLRFVVVAAGLLMFLVRPFWLNIAGLVLGAVVLLLNILIKNKANKETI